MAVKEYLENKKRALKNYPTIYVVKSTREGVSEIKNRSVYNIEPFLNFKRYVLDSSCFPFVLEIKTNESSCTEEGHGTGFGDLWSWTYCSFLDKKEAEKYREGEEIRVYNTYKN